jgi:hypothetical protein
VQVDERGACGQGAAPAPRGAREMPPAGALGLRGGGLSVPHTIAPGRAEQTSAGAASVGRHGLRSVRGGGPDAGLLPGGWVDRIRDGQAGRCYVTSTSCSPSRVPKAAKSLVLNVASGRRWTRQHAAIQVSLTGRGRLRSWPRALGAAPRLSRPLRLSAGDHVPSPLGEVGEFAWSTASEHCPLRQLAQGDERDAQGLAGQPGT